ncbi:MAG: drug/metabolite transporter (DMT)-like permease [Glaciecola sp.]|jgi:drug/metabolite transporter (DMT)-like permease
MSPSQSTSEHRRALLALFGVTIVWGWTFVWMKQAIDQAVLTLGPDGEAAARGLFLAIRFGVAALLLPIFLPSSRRRENWSLKLLLGGGGLGLLLLVGFLLQMTALATLSPAVSAFLTSLYVIFTAFLSLFSAKHRSISLSLLIGVVLATLGAAFISGPPQVEFGLAEWLTVFSAFVFACSILITDATTRRFAPAAVSLCSFAMVALGASLYMAWALLQEGAPSFGQLATLLGEYDFWMPLACCSILATLIALSLLNHYQRMLSPVRAATIYALEPIWGALISALYGMEVLDGWLAVGASALLVGNLIAELGPKKRIKPLPAGDALSLFHGPGKE